MIILALFEFLCTKSFLIVFFTNTHTHTVIFQAPKIQKAEWTIFFFCEKKKSNSHSILFKTFSCVHFLSWYKFHFVPMEFLYKKFGSTRVASLNFENIYIFLYIHKSVLCVCVCGSFIKLSKNFTPKNILQSFWYTTQNMRRGAVAWCDLKIVTSSYMCVHQAL